MDYFETKKQALDELRQFARAGAAKELGAKYKPQPSDEIPGAMNEEQEQAEESDSGPIDSSVLEAALRSLGQ